MIFGASRPRRARPPRASRRTADIPLDAGELPPKLVPSLRLLLSTAVSLAHTRISLAGVELEEEVQRLIGAAALALVVLILVSLVLVVGTFTIVLAVPPEYRVGTMAGLTLVYGIVAVVLGVRLKGVFTNRPPIFGATLAEIDKDRETLSQMARAHDAAEELRQHEARARARGEDAFAPMAAAAQRTTTEGVL